jgi:hypothetical protein
VSSWQLSLIILGVVGAATVAEANAIGTTYLRAQLIAEPARSPHARLDRTSLRRAHPRLQLRGGQRQGVREPPEQFAEPESRVDVEV